MKPDKGMNCRGDSIEERTCTERPCILPCWQEWLEWSTCSKTCGTGIKERQRNKVVIYPYAIENIK